MTATIVNAAPMTRMLGTQDKSTRSPVAEPEVLPQHLPKVYLYTQKGPTTPQLVSGASRSAIYGEDSFDMRKAWATHATELSNTLNAAANAQMIERVQPADAALPASIRLYLDVLPTQVDDYNRNVDGSFALDVNGNKVAKVTKLTGFKVKWIVAPIGLDLNDADTFGLGTIIAGDQTASSVQSQRFPIMDLRVPHFGAYGNDIGLRLWAPTTKSTLPLDDRVIANEKVYPFRMACVSRTDVLSTPKIVETLSAEQFVEVCFKENVINRITETELYAGDVFLQSYQNLDDPNFPPHWGPFGAMHIYDSNISTLLSQFYAAELPFINSFSDLKNEAGEKYRFNMISGMASSGVPYYSYQILSGTTGSVRPSETATIYASGGTDGTMSEALFGGLVADAVADYADENSVLQDTARYPESIIYDSGFPLATKYALCSFIAQRKDTFVVLSVHDVLGNSLTASQESALAIALRTRLQMYPESEYFGTPVMRGMIVGRSGKLLNSQYKKQLPLVFEIAKKAAQYMGASNGSWKSDFNFDQAPASEVTMFRDINVTFTPAAVRNKDWDNGLVWVESYGRRSLYFPALQTVYDNDTSVLNSFFTAMACVELQKVGERARRRFSGESSLTNAQLIEQVNAFIIENTIGRFDDRFIIQPDTYFTAADEARGYSWTTAIKIYAPNMKTVGTLSIEAYRIEDLQS